MVPGPSDVELDPVARRIERRGASSRARLRVGTDLPDAVTRSHLADGRVVGWYGEPGVVVDAEIDGPVPPALAAAYGEQDFWARWTAAECAAKLADVPIAIWLRQHGLSAVGAEIETLRLDDLMVSVGRARLDAP